MIGTNYTANIINNITIYTELTDINSTTNIYSILTVNHNIIISGVSVFFCNREETFPIVTVYRKTRHNAAPFKIFFCTYRVVGVQILSSPSFIVVA